MSHEEEGFHNVAQYVAHLHDVSLNVQGGIYKRGQSYAYTKKIQVATAYIAAKESNGGERPNISALQRTCQVSRAFVRKVEMELNEHGKVINPSDIYANRDVPTGPGSKSLDEMDGAVILFLYLEEPSRQLSSYVDWLEVLTGTIVSESTISRWFNHAFPHKGGLCRPNQVPFDKFRPDNIERALEYLEIISAIAPHRIIFGDEKHLKGKDIFNRKVRRNPMDGQVPPMVVTPDFTNTYNLTGFCTIDPSTPQAVWCSVHELINDADQFAVELEYAIQSGFIRGGHVLIIDNAGVHTGKENTVLQDYLWETYGIFLLFLPARTPEWNPMEQVWKSLVQKLGKVPLKFCQEMGRTARHVTAYAAIEILNGVTHDEVRRFYVGSEVISR